jgi:hypothetical protein
VPLRGARTSTRVVLVEFESGLVDLKFRLLDALGEARNVALGDAIIALHARRVPFQREVFVAGIKALFDQRKYRRHLGLVALHLGCERFLLALATGDVLLLLLNLGYENADLAIQRLPAFAELPFRVLDRHIGLSDVAARQ